MRPAAALRARRIPCEFVAVTPRCGGRLAYRTDAHYTPQSVLAALWCFAGTPNSRRENAEAFARSAFLPQPKITDFRPGPRFRSAKKTIVVLSDFHYVGLWHQPHTFYNNNAPKGAGETAAFGAILLKVRGAGMTSPPGCRGGAPARVKGWGPLDIPRGGQRVGEKTLYS